MLVPRKANYGHHRSEMRRNDDGSLQSVPLLIQKAGRVRGSRVTYLDLSASDLDLWQQICGSLPIQPHGGITLTCCNFISSIKMKYG